MGSSLNTRRGKSDRKTHLNGYNIKKCIVRQIGTKIGDLAVPNKKPQHQVEQTRETESAIRRARIPYRQAEALRTKIATTLKVAKPPPSNITREEQTALKDLATNQDILILPADKGRCTVIFDREQYDKKVQDLLRDKDIYMPLKRDPTSKFKKAIHDVLKRLEEKDKVLDHHVTYLRLNPTTEQPPSFYGLPKIHKPGVPLRPIVSSIGSVTYNLASHLAQILGPLVGKSQHHVQNSAEFVHKIKDINVAEDEIITSYDVCSLFTCITPKEAVAVVREALEADDTLADRTNLSVKHICELLCLGCTYFTYKQQFFQQVHGCSMGSPVSPIVVNLYMEKFENKALSTFNGPPPANWFRYHTVDDTWCRLKERVADDFFDHINQVDDNIKFTQESCQNNRLPLDGNLQFEVYRKPTHTDQYLAFDSHHPLEHCKLAVIKTLFHRADNVITSDEAKTDEHRHLRAALAKPEKGIKANVIYKLKCEEPN
ncbi:uncharacterized protein [Branchiostoma lanceolatum]|uniref:uncharacterized protein n=1 Tax=Branchiostoma lanceolatum TaxID=7740 RepID=UPI003454BCCA